MCQQSQNKCSVDIAACKDSNVGNARQLMQGKGWKNFGILQLEEACLAILVVLKYCFCKLYFLFSQQKDQNPAECKQQ